MVQGVSGHHAEEEGGQAGVDVSWRLGKHGVWAWEGEEGHLGRGLFLTDSCIGAIGKGFQGGRQRPLLQ